MAEKVVAKKSSRRTRRSRARRRMNAVRRGGNRRLAKMAATTGDWAMLEEVTDLLA